MPFLYLKSAASGKTFNNSVPLTLIVTVNSSFLATSLVNMIMVRKGKMLEEDGENGRMQI
jgi:hypothetical protein